jgi:hypothetical protein
MLLLSSACAVQRQIGFAGQLPADALQVSESDGARCVRAEKGPESPFGEALPGPETDPELIGYLEALSPDARRTAVAAGLQPSIARLLRERARSDGRPSLEQLALRQRVDERLAALPSQMLSLEFECECMIALLERVLARHDAEERDRQFKYTIASLVAGAGFSLGAGAWDLANSHAANPDYDDGPLVTALVGAVVVTGLSVAALAPSQRAFALSHAHNILVPMAHGEDAGGIYPLFVFRMLTLPTASGQPTPRDDLLERWSDLIENAAAGDRAFLERLLYGAGGIYDAEAMRLRVSLLAELEITLDSLARHVDELTRALHLALGEGESPRTGAD